MNRLGLALMVLLPACSASLGSSPEAPATPTPGGNPDLAMVAPGPEGPGPEGPDLGMPPDGPAAPLTIAQQCFAGIGDPTKQSPQYDQFHPIIGSHCQGTNHQDITGVQKVVFLGDSVTVGTPPTLPTDFYRFRLEQSLRAKFGALEVASCAAWGAQTDDLLLDPHHQITTCFPGPEPKRTLVIMTVGGNDMHALLKAGTSGTPMSEIDLRVDQSIQQMRDAVSWFRADPTRFPAGVFVVFTNIYEYTDGTGDVSACPAALLDGATPWPQGRPAYVRIQEQFMKIAVDTQTDMLFLLETFCGHGYKNDDPQNECYRGPNTPRWFDLTCIHPTPAGHKQIADMFMAVVNE